MHAVINHVHLNISIATLIPSIEEEAVPLLISLPGFRGVYIVKEAEDRAAFIILWETQEDAVHGGQVLGPTWFAQHIAPHLASDQVRTVGEILVAR